MDLFKLSAATLADDTCFVLAGATAGLGLGDYAGWAICNGNNGTDDWSDRYPRCNIAGGSALSGVDNNTHVHSVDVPSHGHANTLSTTDESAHTHNINHTHVMADKTPGGVFNTIPAAGFVGSSGVGVAHNHSIAGAVTDTDIAAFDSAAAGGATGNRPLSRDCVMMMRV